LKNPQENFKIIHNFPKFIQHFRIKAKHFIKTKQIAQIAQMASNNAVSKKFERKCVNPLFNLFQYFLLLSAIAFLVIVHPSFGQRDSPRMFIKCRANHTLNQCGNLCEQNCDDPPEGKVCADICERPACACEGVLFF
jgi:hypothetical protein